MPFHGLGKRTYLPSSASRPLAVRGHGSRSDCDQATADQLAPMSCSRDEFQLDHISLPTARGPREVNRDPVR